jgi:hypothetical protein
MVVTVWLMVIESPEPFQCFLGLGDSTSAIGWLFHSASLKGNSSYTVAVTIMARKMARILMKADHCLFGQHLPAPQTRRGHLGLARCVRNSHTSGPRWGTNYLFRASCT